MERGRGRGKPRNRPAPNSTDAAEGSANGFANDAAVSAPDAHQDAQNKPRRKRGPRRRGDAPAGGSHVAVAQQPATDGAAAPEQLTWQQQNLLNVAAPAFEPTGEAAGAPVAQARPERRPRPPRPPKQRALHPAPPSQPAHPSGLSAAAAADTPEADGTGPPMCLLCCSPMRLVSFGVCNHTSACGPCCLRMRSCYSNTSCALCKAELKEVVVAPWRPDLPQFQAFLDNPNLAARSAPGQLGPGAVLADTWQPGGRPPSAKLLHDLVRSTALACAVCDRPGRRPFARRSQLEAHLRERHGKHACSMCLREGRTFPLDLPLYDSHEACAAHAAAAHPRCSFCRGRAFYDTDGLWGHLADAHFRCQLCEPGIGGEYAYYADADALRVHLAAQHHACDEPDCFACMVAFTSAEELRRHAVTQHSARMPRWDPSSARRIHLDIQFARRPGPGQAPAHSRGGGEGRQRGGGRPQDVRLLAEGGSGAAGGGRHQRDYALEYEGGVAMIDDDLGLLDDAAAFPRMAASGGPGPAAGAAWAGRGGVRDPTRRDPREEFPSLAATVAPAGSDAAGGSVGNGGAMGGGGRRAVPLVKRTVRCPCGRRLSHLVVQEGQDAPPLDCDAVCQLEGRRGQLAEAFGVGDPSSRVDAFERRQAVWSGALLDVARRHPAWVQGVERELGAFVVDKTAKRHLLSAMPRAQRALAHALAEQYGLASVSQGQEPRRAVEVLKGPGSRPGVPVRLLSHVAPTVPQEQVAALLKEAEGHPVRLIDVAPTVDLGYYLRRWEGGFRLEWAGADAAVVRFDHGAHAAEFLDAFGGGIRGLFRIQRVDPASLTWQPSAVQAAAPWQPERASGGDGEVGKWTAVATVPGSGAQPATQQERPALPSGWTVISGTRAARPAQGAGGGKLASSPGGGGWGDLTLGPSEEDF